jgi:hypothetical protein
MRDITKQNKFPDNNLASHIFCSTYSLHFYLAEELIDNSYNGGFLGGPALCLRWSPALNSLVEVGYLDLVDKAHLSLPPSVNDGTSPINFMRRSAAYAQRRQLMCVPSVDTSMTMRRGFALPRQVETAFLGHVQHKHSS